MSVIYLPEDKRAQVIGQGLGSLIGVFAAQKLQEGFDRDTMRQVYEVQNDGNIPGPQKPLAILDRAGPRGVKMYNDLAKNSLAMALTQQKINTEATLPALHEAQTKSSLANAFATAQKLPGQLQETQARIGEIGASTQEKQALTGKAQADTAYKQAETGQLPDLAASRQATTAKTRAETEKLIRESNALAEGSTTITPEALKQQYPSLTPEQLNAVMAAKSTGDMKKVNEAISRFVSANTRASEGELPTDVRQAAVKAAPLLDNLKKVLNDTTTNPNTSGGPLVYAQAWLAKHGIGNPDPQMLQQLTSGEQLLAEFIQSKGGFGGQYLVNVGREVLPNLMKGKMFQVLESGTLANSTYAGLKANYDALPERLKNSPQASALTNQIKAAEEVAKDVDTLWWTKDGRTIFYHGKQVNPDTFQPIKGGAEELSSEQVFPLGGGVTMTGMDLNQTARKMGITPQQALAGLKAKYGG